MPHVSSHVRELPHLDADDDVCRYHDNHGNDEHENHHVELVEDVQPLTGKLLDAPVGLVFMAHLQVNLWQDIITLSLFFYC